MSNKINYKYINYIRSAIASDPDYSHAYTHNGKSAYRAAMKGVLDKLEKDSTDIDTISILLEAVYSSCFIFQAMVEEVANSDNIELINNVRSRVANIESEMVSIH